MSKEEVSPQNIKIDELAYKEYELAVNTQMHFNEILMKFRTFGVAGVIAVYSYAITRPAGKLVVSPGSEFFIDSGVATSQWIAGAGFVLTLVLALLDIFYFVPLLLGAVDRAKELEETISWRLTTSISSKVSKTTAYSLIAGFYGVILLTGVILIFMVLPNIQRKTTLIRNPQTTNYSSPVAPRNKHTSSPYKKTSPSLSTGSQSIKTGKE